MRRKVQLYIAGRRVDLGDDSWILYNWTREDLANPTAVVNSSSHQVTLPGTCNNNTVFGAAFRLDRRTVFGIRYDGTQFDPTRKTPFTLYDADGTVLEAGYCRLDAVNTRSRIHAYTVSLYGGLGSFFYALDADSEGATRTLASLIWQGDDGRDIDAFFTLPLPGHTVDDAWAYLSTGTAPMGHHFWNIVNFAPCYNGIPEDFDATHAISAYSAYKNVRYQYADASDPSTVYTYKAGLDCALLTFAQAHTEWEVCDLRWYLQRPVVSVRAFFDAICDPRNNGDFTVNLDPTFFRDDNPAWADAWWTLPRIATEERHDNGCLQHLMEATKSPMKYLVDYCKIYGLLFLYNSDTRTVRIVTRATFYGETGAVLDLTPRVDRSQEIRQDPVLADRRMYQMGDGGKGEFVEQYKRDYGRGYGVQRIDTGYEFDAGTKVLTEGQTFQDAADVQESNRLYASAYYNNNASSRLLYIPAWEQVTEELWNDGASVSFPIRPDFTTTQVRVQVTQDTPSSPGADWLPKLQAHGADGKSLDGADILLYFAGFKDTPVVTGNQRKTYYITGDSSAMTDLAGGPCWDLTGSGIPVTALPSFRRVVLSGRYIVDSLEWGKPQARPVLDINYPAGADNSIYGKWWKAYLSDRYDADTRVLTCMADLRGLPVGQALLRRFYWLDGALWTMNAIRNHSLTSWDLTEIELVKVQDRHAYDRGPGSDTSAFLDVSPDGSAFALAPAGETLSFSIRSSSEWTLTGSVAWLDFSRQAGPAGTSVLTVTAQPNTGGSPRNLTIAIENEDGVTVYLNLTQQPRPAQTVSVSPASVTIPATGGQTSALVDASGAWAVDPSTVPAWLTVTASASGISVTAAENTGTARDASVKVYLTGDTTVFANFAVSQDAATPTGGITLLDANGQNSATLPASADGANGIILYLTAPAGAEWTVSEGESWVSLSPVSGTGSRTIAVAVSTNTGAPRECIITAQRTGFAQAVSFYLFQDGASAPTGSIELTRNENPYYNYDEIDGTAQSIPFDVIATGQWTVVSNVAWIHARGSWSGSGNATLWADVDRNTGAARTGTVTGTINGTDISATFTVFQNGDVTRVLSATFNPSSCSSEAQTVDLVIQATEGLAWNIDNVPSGLDPATVSGTGPATVSVAVSATTALRTLSLRVRNSQFSLVSTPELVQLAPVITDYLRVTPFGRVDVSDGVDRVIFRVECSTSWAVIDDSDVPGVTMTPSAGSGNAYIVVVFGENPSVFQRTIPLRFVTTGGTTITVDTTIVQAAPSGDSLVVSTYRMDFTEEGGAETMGVTSSGTWNASVSDSWIRVTPATGSSGESTVAVAVMENTGPARTGTVTFTRGPIARMVTVTQASGEGLYVYPAAVTVRQGGPATVTVFSPHPWHVESLSPYFWVRATPTAGSGSMEGEALTIATRVFAPVTQTYALKIYDDVTGTYYVVTVTQNANT